MALIADLHEFQCFVIGFDEFAGLADRAANGCSQPDRVFGASTGGKHLANRLGCQQKTESAMAMVDRLLTVLRQCGYSGSGSKPTAVLAPPLRVN
ncbi:hypothetical protein DEM27_23725 [Metarhizobium album]|uniref:Uncharacterized protein n=1 Tax=Metarhizobium album TaxID=2182425 RepID=A0A2U2DKU3_9HYPH|nr:hypothetical protein DEM27_23725 [Rhizobium album]